MTREPLGWTVFCDDIRHEVGGKISHIGIYGANMVINAQFPVTIPKLGFVTYYTIDKNDLRREDVEIRIFLPGDVEDEPTMKAGIPLQKIIDEVEDQNSDPDQQSYVLSAQFIASPLTIKEPGTVRVCAYTDDRVIRMGSLKIVQNVEETGGEQKETEPALT